MRYPRGICAALMLGAVCTAAPAAVADGSGQPVRLFPLPSLGNGIDLGLAWNADAYENLHGGSQRGYATDSVVSLGLGLDTGALGAWQGGRFQLDLQAIASTHPSAYAGDLQTLSNLDAPNQRHIAKIWYAQEFGNSLLRAGIIDMNSYFDVNDAAGLFPNSSFGIIPSISANVPAPIYPDFGWGIMARLDGAGGDWLLGAFQGNPADRASALRDGATLIAERDWHLSATRSGLGIGAWYRRAPAQAGAPTNDWGAYANLQHPLPGHPDAVGFVQIGTSPGAVNQVPAYLGAGVHLYDVSATVSDLGFGLARAWIRGGTAETSVETTALVPIGNGSVALQPDLQYILHPSGQYPNALVVGLRLHLTLY